MRSLFSDAGKDDRPFEQSLDNQRFWQFTGGGLLALAFFLFWFGLPGGLAAKANWVGFAVCNQMPAHSFTFGGHQFPLCARCTGQYLGAWSAFLFLWGKRRLRAGRWPHRSLLMVLFLLFFPWIVDGINSYGAAFFAGPLFYTPHNSLRLLTGSGEGVVLLILFWPLWAQTTWQQPDATPVLGRWGELTALLVVVLFLDGILFFGAGVVREFFAYFSTSGVIVFLTGVNTIFATAAARREGKATGWQDVWPLLAAGLVLTLFEIMAMDHIRLWLLPGAIP